MTDCLLKVSLLLPSSGQWDATCQTPNPPGKIPVLNGTETPASRSKRRISVTHLFLPSLAKHLFQATIHHNRPPPRSLYVFDLVESRGGFMRMESEFLGLSKLNPGERRPSDY
jgi:hypothetical protein